MIYLICHVILHDHLIKRLCEFMGGNSLGYVTTLISDHKHCDNRDIFF